MKMFAYAKSWDRVADRAMAIAPDLVPVLIHVDGSLTCGGESVAHEDVEFDAAWASSDLFLTGPAGVAFKLFRNNHAMKWFQSGAAGFDHPVFSEIASNGTLMTRSDAQGIAIAEFIFARVFELLQPVMERRQAQENKEWYRPGFSDMWGKTWMIIGMGAIGNETAIRAKAFGCRVIGVRRNPTGDEAADEMIQPGEVTDRLPEADIVVLTTPLNEETHHMVNADFLKAMKLKSILVNVGRGGLVNEQDLFHGLFEGRPGNAILDVFNEEPLPDDSPLWHHKNVLMTAHCAAFSPLTQQRGDALFVENLRRYVAGEPLKLVVEGLA